MAWVLRITDTVPLSNRKEYVEACKALIEEAPKGAKHIGSWRVAYGHALDFMHLWEFESIDEFSSGSIPMTDKAQELGGKMLSLFTDTHWEWLTPLDG